MPFDLPPQGVRVCFIDAPNTQIELIQPLDDTSPIANFLKKNPAGGQHHLCFEVADIPAAVAELQAKGATLLASRVSARMARRSSSSTRATWAGCWSN